MQRRRAVIAGIVGVIGVVAGEAAARRQQQEPPDDQLPRFAPGGRLLPPVGWEAWVMVGSSTRLSYAAAPPPAAGAAPGMFHNAGRPSVSSNATALPPQTSSTRGSDGHGQKYPTATRTR